MMPRCHSQGIQPAGSNSLPVARTVCFSGHRITAAVVARPGAVLSEETIIDSVKSRLARYKVPKRILVVDELPRNTMGKVQKNTLRKTFAAIYTVVP